MISRIIRGCSDLPYIGRHCGIDELFIAVAFGGAVLFNWGIYAVLTGMGFMATIFVPRFLFSAYVRAELSDKLVSGEKCDLATECGYTKDLK